MPYVSHDIGTFFSESPQGICDPAVSPYVAAHENSLSPEMYVRWLQLGTFQPLDRLHSHHGRRLPWEYEDPARTIAADFLRLRESLVPYLYTLAREAHDSGLPMVRALYLQWPRTAAAYRHASQHTLGRDLLVAPVAKPGDPAEVEVWFPPGRWVDWFTGKKYRGPGVKRLSVPLERMPVFARAGAIVPTQPAVRTTAVRPPRTLVLNAFRGNGRFTLYDDAGDGFGYERSRFSHTRITQAARGGRTTITIGAARGRFPEQIARRAYEVRVVGVARPQSVTVNGRRTRRWTHSAATLALSTGRLPTSRAATISIR